MGDDGPKVPTPLAVEFYSAFRRSGLTYEEIADRIEGLSVKTVWAYINGTRGGTQRSESTVRRIAGALGVPESRAIELAGLVPDNGLEQAINAWPGISRADKKRLVEELRAAQRRYRR